ncbi:MAG TPA: hypothetical protein PKC76_15855 [Saprospiraceae bacterium]|nr:hypothetical protein [Saprospiraceae bacterium]HMP25606.1 hypothetical protein [Saprospiraceae bacterium]
MGCRRRARGLIKVTAQRAKIAYLACMDWNVQHQEHRDWLSQLDFYEDQMRTFQKELLKIVQHRPDYLSIVEHVDEYRRILLRKLEHMDALRHAIMQHERQISNAEFAPAEAHEAVKVQLLEFVADFEKLKVNFRRFVAYNQPTNES